MPPADPGAAAREHLLAAHADTLDAVLTAADAVAADWSRLEDGRPATADRDALVDPLRDELDERGELTALTNVLVAAVDAAGYALPATPVPAPPYVVLSSTGPVLRGTVADGRLVIEIDCFEVVREPAGCRSSTAYARTNQSPAEALFVSYQRS